MTRTYESGEIEWCARAAHELNRFFSSMLGDKSHLPWEDAPDWQKRSARLCASGILNDGHTAEQSHLAWVADKVADGWRRGPSKDIAKKEHPCLVPYAELDPVQRAKNELFVSVVKVYAQTLRSLPTQ